MFGRPPPSADDSHQGSRPRRDPFESARHDMIEHHLRARGVVMHAVLDAMRTIPRHLFIPHAHIDRAYADEALPSLDGQTISQPFIVGIMTQELSPRPGHRILEIGTGTGYQTAILARLVGPTGEVCTIERSPQLSDFARRRLDALAFHNVRYFVGDGTLGWPHQADAAPPLFDRILVTAGAPSLPAPLLRQLTPGGIMIIPVGPTDSQQLLRIQRQGDQFMQSQILGCRFVPLIGENGWSPPTSTQSDLPPSST